MLPRDAADLRRLVIPSGVDPDRMHGNVPAILKEAKPKAGAVPGRR
jgi:hypothetical protein